MDRTATQKMARCRELLKAEEVLVVPGAHDCGSARIIEHLGFEIGYITGAGLEATLLGKPDIGLTSLRDAVYFAGNISSSVGIPMFCDADTGYGGPMNVYYAVQEFERAGICGIHIEDQATPKKCGLMAGRKVIQVEEMQEKIRAACDARKNNDFLIIGRTDAKSVMGVEEAARRYNAYFKAGADLALMAESYTKEEMKTLLKLIDGPTALCGGLPGLEAHLLTIDDYKEMGAKMVIFPVASVFANFRAALRTYTELKQNRGLSAQFVSENLVNLSDFNNILGYPFWEKLETGFGKFQ